MKVSKQDIQDRIAEEKRKPKASASPDSSVPSKVR